MIDRGKSSWVRARNLLFGLLVGGVAGASLVAVPLSPPAAAAVGDACDSDGDGDLDGVETEIVSDGDDRDALDLREELGLNLSVIDDPQRWFVIICEGDEWELLDGPTAGLAPQASQWVDLLREEAEGEARDDFWRPYPWIMPDHAGFQTVNHQTWLAVDPVVFEDGSRVITKRAEGYGLWVDVVATALGADFEFSDGTSEFCPADLNQEYDGTFGFGIPCGRGWEKPSGRGEVSFEVSIRYSVTWTSSLGTGSATPEEQSSTPLSEFDLEVTEIQSYLSEDGTRVPKVPEFSRGPSLREGDDECSGISIIYKPGCLADFVLDQILEQLPAPIRTALETIIATIRGCGLYAEEGIQDLVSSITQVVEALSDPVKFMDEKWQQALAIRDAVESDAQGFFDELVTSGLEQELGLHIKDSDGVAAWAGYLGCKALVAFVTGGASKAQLLQTVQKAIDKITPDARRPDRDRDDDDPNSDDDSSCNLATGSCSCKKNSFPAGTPVLMADGSHTSIELVRPGDRVATFSERTGQWSANEVLAQWSGVHTGEMVTVTLSDGSQVSSTDDHLFWVSAATGSWVEADQLQPGDLLLTPGGVTPVADVIVHAAVPLVVWELDTANDDTFVVGSTGVAVHNAGCGDPPSGEQIDKMLDDNPELKDLPKTSAKDIEAAWQRYEGNMDAEEWLAAYARIRKNNTGGSAFELKGLNETLGLSDDQITKTLFDPEKHGWDDLNQFIPDHSELLDDGSFRFAEVKNYVNTTLQPSSNAGQMLEFLRRQEGGVFDLVINEDTVLSESFERLIERAMNSGVEVNITRIAP